MKDAGKFKAGQWLQDGVDVVGHNGPSVKMVSFPMKIKEGVLYDIGDFRALHPAVPDTGIQMTFNLLGE